MRASRMIWVAAAGALAIGVAAVPAAAEPTEPTETTAPPETTLPPDTTAPPDTTLPPATTAPPETTLPPDTAVPEATQLTPEATPPNPHLPNPLAAPDTGIGLRGDNPKRILFIGNSIMNQAGPEAQAFLNNFYDNQTTVQVEAVGQSSLYSKNQYRLGETHVKVNDPGAGATFNWLLRAQQLVNTFNPTITVVEFGYNYKAPFPKDSAGNEIQVGTSQFVRMAKQQAKALTNTLRSRGGQVLFVSPLPLNNATAGPIMSGSWNGFMQARNKKHFGILYAGDALDGNGGAYTSQMTWCTGGIRTVRNSDGLHLNDNGIELMGEALVRGLKQLYGLVANPSHGTKFC